MPRPKLHQFEFPWGSVKDVKLEERTNSRGENHSYLVFCNEQNDYKAFKINEMSIAISACSEFNLDIQRLKASGQEELLSKYLS